MKWGPGVMEFLSGNMLTEREADSTRKKQGMKKKSWVAGVGKWKGLVLTDPSATKPNPLTSFKTCKEIESNSSMFQYDLDLFSLLPAEN